MRVALKIAYDGRSFHGHQRQPQARTVEGECLRALRSARILSDPRESFFRSASRTDSGVSAVGNVIAFNSALGPEAVVGAFNNRARDVWAWAVAEVPESFHPRHARERWYRYHLFGEHSVPALRDAASMFVGVHDFRWFASDPSTGMLPIRAVEVTSETDAVLIDVRARSFRRGMVRRIVSAMLKYASGEVTRGEIQEALKGQRYDFGMVPPEPLFLMEVAYDFAFHPILKPKVLDEWHALSVDLDLRGRWLQATRSAAAPQDR